MAAVLKGRGILSVMGVRHLDVAKTFVCPVTAISSVPSLRQASDSRSVPVLLRNIEKEHPEPVETKIQGEVPAWINGSLLRNGPGKFKVGNDSYNHLFDGLSLLTRFNISEGKVTYQSRFQRSNAYTKAMEQNRIVISEFGTVAHPDPCLSLFGRFMAWFKPKDFTDNCNVNWMTIGDECYVMTETKNIRKIDPVSLETLDKVDISKRVAVHSASAHPHIDNDGTVYNMGSQYAKQTHYNIIKMNPPDPGVKGDPLSKASILCSIPASHKFPSYYHSFGMTDNYLVFLEQPLVLNLLKYMTRLLLRPANGFSGVLEFQEKQPARFHVVRRDTGELLPQKFMADTFFCFHHINAYEEAGHVVVDLCCYEDGAIIDSLVAEKLKTRGKDSMRTDAVARRFVLPLGAEKIPGVNLNSLEYSKASAMLKDDGSIHCTPEVIADTYVEVPRVNYEKHNGKPYNYFYGVKHNQELLRVNTRTATSHGWSEEGCYPSEPVFIGAPGSTSEDDGVVISAVVDMREGKSPFLLVLDARDLREVARASIDAEVPFGIHGIFRAN